MTLISETLTNAIQEQISSEIFNSNLYLFLAGFLKNKGLDNLGDFFLKQSEEEIGHSRMFFGLLTDLNAEVKIPEISSPDVVISTIKDIANAYLNREMETTNSIAELKKLAMDDDNPVCEEFFRKMIGLQQSEYEESNTFMDKANLMPEWWQVALWDIGIKCS